MTKRALVTGGAGFIGSHVSDLFLSHGWTVDIIDNLSTGKRKNAPAAATLCVCDIRSDEAARIIADGQFDAILHLAAQIDVRKSVVDPVFDAGVNIVGVLHLLEALQRSGRGPTTRFVFSSTGGAIYGDFVTPPNVEATTKEPESPYAISKLAVEHYLAYYARVHGFDPITVRFGNVYGPRQDPHGEAGVVAIFCGRILTGRPLTIYGNGKQTRDYVHVRDVAQAMYQAATWPHDLPRRIDDRAFNIGTGTEATVVDLAEALIAAAGVSVPIEFAPERPGELMRSVLAVDKARKVLGWKPKLTLEAGLADTYAWFAERAASTSGEFSTKRA